MGFDSPWEEGLGLLDFIGHRQEGTGQWFLDAPEFRKWLHTLKETLFCPGIPGAGKTMTAAVAIDHLWNNHLFKAAPGDAVGVAYVYCNYKTQSNQNAAALLAALIRQLVQARPSITEPVESLHEKHSKKGTKPSLEQIFRLLQSVLANYSSVYIVVDALDECPERDGIHNQFLTKLYELQGKMDLRLMVTSRFIPDIVNKFSKALTLEVRASKEDVRRYVSGQIPQLPKRIQRDATLQKMVQDKVVEAVDSMFLLALLHVDSLRDKMTKSKVQSTLETLSTGSEGLEKAYDDAME